jgi:hypothetical protein
MLLHNPKLRLDRVRPDDHEYNVQKREKEQTDSRKSPLASGSAIGDAMAVAMSPMMMGEARD